MNLGYRYHIASLASVFFALGIGVVMGTLVVGGKVVDRQAKLVQQLEHRMEDLQLDIKRRGQSDTALQKFVMRGVISHWKSKSVGVVSIENSATKAIDKGIGELGMPLDTRRIRYKDGKWLDEFNPDASPAISLKLDGSEDQKARILLFVLPSGSAFSDFSSQQLQDLLMLFKDVQSIGCKVVILSADDGNAGFLQLSASSGFPVVTNSETSLGLSAVMLSPWAKPAIYGAGPLADEDLPAIQWKVIAP